MHKNKLSNEEIKAIHTLAQISCEDISCKECPLFRTSHPCISSEAKGLLFVFKNNGEKGETHI